MAHQNRLSCRHFRLHLDAFPPFGSERVERRSVLSVSLKRSSERLVSPQVYLQCLGNPAWTLGLALDPALALLQIDSVRGASANQNSQLLGCGQRTSRAVVATTTTGRELVRHVRADQAGARSMPRSSLLSLTAGAEACELNL